MILRSVVLTSAFGLLVAATTLAQTKPQAVLAFEHYDAIRASLANDSTTTVAKHATALAQVAEEVGGMAAHMAAEELSKAKTLDDARKHFGVLSEALVPKFLAARIPDVYGFTCPMRDNKPWAQRSKTIQNPYFGKSMPGCGTAIEPGKNTL